MANYNLTSQQIKDTYEQLAQISGSVLVDGTGSAVNSLEVSASYATSALTASYALNAEGVSVDTGSLLVTASAALNVITFTKGDNSTFNVTVDTGSGAGGGGLNPSEFYTYTASNDARVDSLTAATSSYLTSADISGKLDTSVFNTYTSSNDSRVDSLTAATSSYLTSLPSGVVSSSAQVDLSLATGTAANATNATNADNIALSADSTNTNRYISFTATANGDGTLLTDAGLLYNSFANTLTTTTVVADVTGDLTGNADTATSASYATNADTLDGLEASAFAQTAENNSFSGTQTFNNIAVNGTGSFAYIQSVTGSAKIIGDAFIVLNADSPTERYAGIKVYDSGSSPISTGSFQWDSVNNDWFYEYDKDATDYAVALFGPEFTTKGTPTYPTTNSIQKGTGGHHLGDSLLSDDGSTVSMTGTFDVTGAVSSSVGFKGDLDGIATNAVSASISNSSTTALLATTASFALTASYVEGGGSSAGLVSGTGTDSMKSDDSLTDGGTIASGGDSIALGEYAQASAGQSIAIGRSVIADGTSAIAIGRNSYAYPAGAITIGSFSENFTGDNGIIIGQSSTIASNKDNVIAIGNTATGNETDGIAIGRSSQVASTATAGVSIGLNSEANGAGAVGLGNNARGDAAGAISIGQNSQAAGSNSIAIGNSGYTNGTGAVSIGNGTYNAGANSSINIGNASGCTSLYTIAIGDNLIAGGTNAIAIGRGTATSANNEINIGTRFKYDGTSEITLDGSIVKIRPDGANTGSLIDNIHPTIASSSAQINHIVTITQDQYTALSGSGNADADTIYVVSDEGDYIHDGNLGISGQLYSPFSTSTVASSTSSIDFNEGNFSNLSLTSATYIDNPSNLKSGTTYTLVINSGSLISNFNTAWKFAGGVTPTFSNGTDVLTMVSDGSNLYATALSDFS